MKISIITVCYNAEATISDTITSVAQQDWADFEHIIIDGASSDGTLAITEALKHQRLRVVSKPDEGIYDAMNKGLAQAKGEYVAFLNADDLYVSDDVLQAVAKAACRTGADLVLGDTQFVDSGNIKKYKRLYSARRFEKWWIKLGIMPPHPSLFARRSLLEEAGGFDTSYKICADFDLIARMILQYNASWVSLNYTTTLFREGGLSTQGGLIRPELSLEFSRSLKSLGIPAARWRVMLRYPIKALQFVKPAGNKNLPLATRVSQ